MSGTLTQEWLGGPEVFGVPDPGADVELDLDPYAVLPDRDFDPADDRDFNDGGDRGGAFWTFDFDGEARNAAASETDLAAVTARLAALAGEEYALGRAGLAANYGRIVALRAEYERLLGTTVAGPAGPAAVRELVTLTPETFRRKLA